MSATAALILLMDAAIACSGPAATSPRAGADAVRAILDVESQSFEPSAPTWAGARQPPAEAPTDDEAETGQPDENASPMQCDLIPTVIA
jgi:hypothetical protein